MTITFDQLLDCVCGNIEPEDDFDIQRSAHRVGALIMDWQAGNISDNQIRAILNLATTGADPEQVTVKNFLATLTLAQGIALEAVMILCQSSHDDLVSGPGISYDKTYLRQRFGL